jgi:hypothetical protein
VLKVEVDRLSYRADAPGRNQGWESSTFVVRCCGGESVPVLGTKTRLSTLRLIIAFVALDILLTMIKGAGPPGDSASSLH